jgi:serine/threonine protein kinase
MERQKAMARNDPDRAIPADPENCPRGHGRTLPGRLSSGRRFSKDGRVKKVLPHLADNRDFIDMFIREARLAALLQHPNVVQIADFGKIQNAYFIAMEYVNGKKSRRNHGFFEKRDCRWIWRCF